MFARDVEEIMWHFIGYLHMADVTAKARLSYDVFRQAKAQEQEKSDPAQFFRLPRYQPDDLPSDPAWAGYIPILWLYLYTPGKFHGNFVRLEAEIEGEAARYGTPALEFLLPSAPSAFAWGEFDFEITITYTDGGNGQAVINILQSNFLTNANMLTYGQIGSVWDFHDPEAVDEKLGKAFDSVAAWTPETFVPEDHSHQAFLDMVLAHSAARAEDGPDHDPSPPQFGKYITVSGIYINGELQELDDEGETDGNDLENGSESPSALTIFAEDANQIMSLGGNTSANIAVAFDASEAWGSIVILGDYYKLDGIFQFNIYHGSTQVTTDGYGILYDWEKNKAVAENIATFTNDTESVFGNATLEGVYPGLNWNVHIHDGDYWNITMIRQENWLMTENFAAHVGQGWGSEVALGYNDQINITEIWNFGFEYDLIIVAGNKYEYSLIFQTNILINDNVIFLLLGDDEGAEGGVAGGNNELINEASIVNYGNGDMLKAMTPEVEAFVQLLADKQGSIEIDEAFIEFASTLPGNGTNEFNILYVTGDFYSLKLIDQLNVIVDMNVGIQAPPDQDHGFEGDGWAQFVEAGGNTAANFAAIINMNSTSDFQYLAGDKYHDMLLVQEEMVAEDYQLVYQDTQKLVPEVIAFLEAPEGADEDGYPVWTENQAGQDEGFSGVLT